MEVATGKSKSRTKRTASKISTSHSMSHADNLKRLARIKGQIAGVEKMMNDGRYCVDILQQIKSARAAILGLECAVMENHLRGCVQSAFKAKNPFEADQKIQELIKLMKI